MIFFIRWYRRFYLWTHKKYREINEIHNAVISILKSFEHFEDLLRGHTNISTRRVIVEKYTAKHKAEEERLKKMQRENSLKTLSTGPR